ncbi:hypothetical protein D3H55_20525 [Bacillus salacetis]|uniref:Uncharacterized protein n=1 Tax=Bacillus salacetis TaxID=2315464 RepID=A0A3A1QT48_9BACI|nr:hypothetical protein [Bacillus salacetis]RIW28953.1 hypothetical protein D3H55_20525 [Bacillus salacetis]
MGRTVTFAFQSMNFDGTEASETFTLEELGIDGELADGELKKNIDQVFHAWLCDKLNITFSVVMEEQKQE